MPADSDLKQLLKGLAEHEGLTYMEEGKLASMAPVMRKDDAQAHSIAAGRLPGGIDGLVADLYYTVKSGSEHEPPKPMHSTILMTGIPESVGLLPVLTAHDAKNRSLGELLIGAGGLIPFFEKIEFESIKFNTTYRVGVAKRQDENWVRQLFSPSFIDYLAEQAPEGCYFDLWGGSLTVALGKAVESQEELRHFCEFGAHIAERIRSEALENEDVTPYGLTSEGGAWVEAVRKANVELDKVKFSSPPENVKKASKKYRGLARRSKAGWLISLGIALFVGLLPAGFLGVLVAAVVDDSDGDGVKIGAIAFAALFVPLFLWMFISLRRAVVRGTSESYGVQAFMRSYASQRKLTELLPVEVQVRHMRLQPPGVPIRAFGGQLPQADAEGELALFRAEQKKGLSANLAVFAKTRVDRDTPVVRLLPAGEGGFVAAAGLFIQDVKGLKEPDSLAAAREEMREHLGKELAGRYQVVGDPEAAGAVEKLVTPDLQRELLEGVGGRPLYVTLAGGDLMIYGAPEKVTDWDAQSIDSFCQAAGRIVHALDAAA